jgi:predicted HTH domain antitoxin
VVKGEAADWEEVTGKLFTMQVTVELPADILQALQRQWADPNRQALKAIAVEEYRTGALSESQVRRLPGLESRFEVHALLKEHRVPLRYSATDLEDDIAAHRELGIVPER